jgi:hypothetical protein
MDAWLTLRPKNGVPVVASERLQRFFAEQRTGDLTHKEAIAYDITSALIAGVVPPALIFEQAVGLFVKMVQRNSSIVSVCIASRIDHPKCFDVPAPEI